MFTVLSLIVDFTTHAYLFYKFQFLPCGRGLYNEIRIHHSCIKILSMSGYYLWTSDSQLVLNLL